MLTTLTTAFCCDAPKAGVIDEYPNVPAIRNGNLQNIAKAIDIISGFFLIVYATAIKNSALLGVCGGVQLWPFAVFITTVLYECKKGGPKGDIVFVMKPCCCTQAAPRD